MKRSLKCFFRGMRRIYPDCVTIGQAIAFNAFIAFFPILLLSIGVLSSTSLFHGAIREIQERLGQILPPGSDQVVAAYFVRRGTHVWRWIWLGAGGTLIAGSQVMVGYIEAFRMIERDPVRLGYWHRQFRAFLLLCITLIPSLAVIVMTVFGKQARAWLIHRLGWPNLIREAGLLFYAAVVFLLAMFVLVLLYRFGRPGYRKFRDLLPGAAVATILWWAVDISLGFYVRKVPYNVIYGGLAAAIGLIIWMYLTALVVLLGDAYNAEARHVGRRR